MYTTKEQDMTTLIKSAQKLITCMRLDRIEAGDWPDDSREAYLGLKQAIAQEQKPKSTGFDLLVITTAYEQGYGKGLLDQGVPNVYVQDSPAFHAWQLGHEEGRMRLKQQSKQTTWKPEPITAECAAPPAQPALSDEDFYKIVRPFYGTDEACKMALPMSIDEFRAIEAHCRGGVK